MRDIKKYIAAYVIIGVVFCIYGWIQNVWGGSIETGSVEVYCMKKSIINIIFVVCGGMLIFIGCTLEKVSDQIQKQNSYLSNKIVELEKKIKNLK
jgi:hypothetical protein